MARKRKLVFPIILVLLFALLAGGGVVGRAVVLRRLTSQIRSTVDFSRISLSILPPALVLEDVRSKSAAPYFSAKRVVVTVGVFALLSREKPATLVIDQPAVRVTADALLELLKKKSGPTPAITVHKAWIRGGELTFSARGASFHSRGINAVFAASGGKFSLQAETADTVLALASSPRRFQGSVRLLLNGRGDRVHVSRFIVEGPDLAFKANGQIANLADPDLDFRVVFNGETSLPMDIFRLPLHWSGKTRGEGTVTRAKKRMMIDLTLASNEVAISHVPLGEVTGRFELHGPRGLVDLTVNNHPAPRGYVKIEFGRGPVSGKVSGVRLDAVMKEIVLPWPVQSQAWGDFTVQDGHLHVEAELRDETLLPAHRDIFPFRGRAQVDWDGKTQVTFSSKKMLSNFASVDVGGRVNIGRDMDITITGDVADVSQARRFAEIILNTRFGLPPTGGRGSAEIKLFGDYRHPTFTSEFFLFPGGFDTFAAAFVEGSAEIKPGRITGLFKVDDPQMTGVVKVSSLNGILDVDIKASRARAEYILRCLGVFLPLSGEGDGRFTIKGPGEALKVSGEFNSTSASFAGLPLRDVKGRLELAAGTLSFPDLRFSLNGGSVEGRGFVGFQSRQYSVDASGTGIDLAPLQPGLRGLFSFTLKGQGLLGKDIAAGKVETRNPGYEYLQAAQLTGDLTVNVLPDHVEAKLEGLIGPGRNDYSATLGLPSGAGFFSLDLKGGFENLDILLPWSGAKGRLNYLAQVRGTEMVPRIDGAVDFQGSVLPLPKFSQAFTDYSGLIFVENQGVSLRSFQARLGGGDVHGSGELRLTDKGPTLSIGLEGKDMLLVPWERTRALADGTVQLVRDAGRFVLDAKLQVKKLSWRREINEPFAFSSTPYYRAASAPGIFDDLTLNMHFKANDDAVMENSLGRIRGRFDLTVSGSVNSPILLGTIESLSGTINFQDRRYNVLRANLSFFNPLTVDPYLDFKGETYVKDYRVTFSLSGLLDHLKPDFTSSPPLPPEDVMALLAMGESFRKLYSYDSSTQLSSASMLTFQLTDEARKSAARIFTIDRISIDPFIMSSSMEMVPRLTLGKKISRGLVIYYSTNLTTQREEIVNVEWELGSNFSLVGTRDEIGRLSLDVKVRKRF
jgi:hypothetical protein